MIAISYRREDTAAITGRIYDRLQAKFGRDRVFMDLESIPSGVDFRTHISESLNRCNTLLVVIGPHWLAASPDGSRRIDDPTDFVRLEVAQALARNIRVIPLLIDRTDMPSSSSLPEDLKRLARRYALRVDSGADFDHHIDWLCSSLQSTFSSSLPTLSASPLGKSASSRSRHATQTTRRAIRAYEQDHGGGRPKGPKTSKGPKDGKGKKGGYRKGGKIILVLEEYCAKDLFVQLAAALGGPVNLKKKGKKKGKKGGPKGPKGGPKGPKGGPNERVKTLVPPEPVLLGISMPRQVEAGSSFTARFAAYIESAKISAKEHLKALGEKDDRIVTDIRPDREARWRIGAPVTIRLTGEHVTIAQSERSFEWNGRENLISFVVSVNSDAPQTIQLCFHVLIGPLEIAFIPVSVAISAGSTDAKSSHIKMRAPSSAFASYSSKDAQPVTQSLSTLAHWAPTLNIFQDCLDLRPNEAFKEQIKKEIATRDVFLLFWSRNASASKWVLWELETARAKPGLNAILPMPLEDPAIVPPPSGFEDKHLRDRFLLAGYGLKKIAEIASKKGPGSS
jgi:hypothetical protein